MPGLLDESGTITSGGLSDTALRRLQDRDDVKGFATQNKNYGQSARNERFKALAESAAKEKTNRLLNVKKINLEKQRTEEAAAQFKAAQAQQQSQFAETMAMRRKEQRDSEPGFIGSLFGK